jgi:hypothetical protein
MNTGLSFCHFPVITSRGIVWLESHDLIQVLQDLPTLDAALLIEDLQRLADYGPDYAGEEQEIFHDALQLISREQLEEGCLSWEMDIYTPLPEAQ